MPRAATPRQAAVPLQKFRTRKGAQSFARGVNGDEAHAHKMGVFEAGEDDDGRPCFLVSSPSLLFADIPADATMHTDGYGHHMTTHSLQLIGYTRSGREDTHHTFHPLGHHTEGRE